MARVLITGCSSGIGRAAARSLSEGGHEVVATARRPETLDDLDVDARLQLDVTDPTSVEACIAAAGEVDVLVNNAGVSAFSPFELGDFELIERVFATNLFGALRMTRAVLPQMRERRRGRIIQISSGAARAGLPLLGLYGGSKIALETISQALRQEVRGFGIAVVVLRMGAIGTSMDDNRVEVPVEGTPYHAPAERMLTWMRDVRSTPSPVEAVCDVIAEAIDTDDPPLRMYVESPLRDASVAQTEADADWDALYRSVMHPDI